MRTKKHTLDKFYTKPDVASQLISLVDIRKYSLVVEPSAGTGAFSKQIKGCVALDLLPEEKSIIKADFFNWYPDASVDRANVLVIGNPPFGRQCSLALKFCAHAAEFASSIAFVLPKSFKKTSIKNRMPKNFHLVLEKDLDDNSFTLNGTDYSVPCVFQVWEEKTFEREIIIPAMTLPDGFSWTKKPELANVAIRRVGVNAGKAFNKNMSTRSEQSHCFLQVPVALMEAVVSYINNIHWEHGNTAGPRSISKREFSQQLAVFKGI